MKSNYIDMAEFSESGQRNTLRRIDSANFYTFVLSFFAIAR